MRTALGLVLVVLMAPCAALSAKENYQRHNAVISYGKEIPLKAPRPFGVAERANWRLPIDTAAFSLVRNLSGVAVRSRAKPAVGGEINMVLPERGETRLRIAELSEVVPGVTTLAGVLAEDSEGVFTISIHDGRVFGSIRDRKYNWNIEPDGASHRLRKVERRLIPRVTDQVIVSASSDSAKKAPSIPGAPKTGGSGRVDILFLHANNVSSAASIASNIISNFNSALSSSLVSSNNYVASAGVQLINDDFDGLTKCEIIGGCVDPFTWFPIPGLMHERATPFADLVTDRMFHANADVAFLLIEEDEEIEGDVGEFGRVGGIAHSFNAESPFALSTDNYALDDYTALHEIGHVLNGFHEDCPDSTNCGKVYSPAPWQTLMGGYDDPACEFDVSLTCERIRYFSNPSVSYGGVSTGDSGVHDMESALESTMVAVSSWRDDGDPVAPGVPSSITRVNEYCYGANTIDWSAVTGADSYRLYESSSSAFTSPVVVYTGTNTEAGVTVPNGSTRYYRVRACDDDGCSNYTSQVFGTYYPGCA